MKLPVGPPLPPEVSQALGLAVYYAQKLEREIKLLFLAYDLPGAIQPNSKSALANKDFFSKQTLDELIRLLARSGSKTNLSWPEVIENAVKDRHFLLHELFQDQEPLHLDCSPEQVKTMLTRISKIQLSLGKLYLHLRWLRKKRQSKDFISQKALEERLRKIEGRTQ